jgi:iron complex outermembrane receptor protein
MNYLYNDQQGENMRNTMMTRAVRWRWAWAPRPACAATRRRRRRRPLPKVEITGSAIKRIEAETALPVQVITREEIDKVGVTTATEILARCRPTSAA